MSGAQTSYRTGWAHDLSEPEPEGFFMFSGRRKRSRWRGDVHVVDQVPVVPADPEKAAEAARLNAIHREAFGRG